MGRKRAQMDVTLKLLIDSGEIRPGTAALRVSTRDQTRSADLNADGIIAFEGECHRSLSSFAVAAIRSCGAVGRKTANGWQVVYYQGRPLEQYRTEYLEKQSQESESSGEMEAAARKGGSKKRRTASRCVGELEEAASDMESALRSSESGGTRAHSPERLIPKHAAWSRDSTQRRLRPSPTWFDTMRGRAALNHETSLLKPSVALSCADAACGMKLESAIQLRGNEEEETTQTHAVLNMWLKKALNKRHREECGMT